MSRTVRHAPGASTLGGPSDDVDGYLDKLVKYVPAEVTAVSAAFFATWTVDGAALFVSLAVLASANVLYLYVAARRDSAAPATRWYFYVLSTVAFATWATAVVDPVAAAFRLSSDAERAFVLAAAAFLVPLLDSAAGLVHRTPSSDGGTAV